jgi:hypothetical protein
MRVIDRRAKFVDCSWCHCKLEYFKKDIVSKYLSGQKILPGNKYVHHVVCKRCNQLVHLWYSGKKIGRLIK